MAKYVVRARIEVDGSVDKSDIIGAIFGYTEGLFGPEFDLRELQDKGRIGRIIVEVRQQGGKTVGEVLIPSNLDKAETALLAAMIEAVEKVGPYQARITVVDLIDVRAEKLKRIAERAKELLVKWSKEKTPDLREVLNEIISAAKAAEMIFYGSERLPAGPEVESSDTVIIVEGRADVINLLKYGYRNVIALGGAGGVPESIIKLCSKKKCIAFMDGDHAGDLILRDLLKTADIDYVARAPPGKEVEELTSKEIAKALKNTTPASQYLSILERKLRKEAVEVAPPKPTPPPEEVKVLEIPLSITEDIKKLLGTLEAILYDNEWKAIEKLPVRDLVDRLNQLEPGKVHAIVFDGIITQRLVDTASNKGIKIIIGVRIGNLARKPSGIQLLTFQDILTS
mgnify:CR=1 FL=1